MTYQNSFFKIFCGNLLTFFILSFCKGGNKLIIFLLRKVINLYFLHKNYFKKQTQQLVVKK